VTVVNVMNHPPHTDERLSLIENGVIVAALANDIANDREAVNAFSSKNNEHRTLTCPE